MTLPPLGSGPAVLGAASLDPHLFLRHRAPCSGRLACDLQAFTLPEFTVPVRYGAVALGVGLVVGILWRRFGWPRRLRRQPVPIGGLLFTAAALAAYQHTGHLVRGLALSAAWLAAGGVVADLARLPGPARAVLAAPGAWELAAHTALPVPHWAKVLVGAFAALGAWLVPGMDRRHAGVGLGPVLLAVTLAGLYEAVPDPDFALVLVGAALPLVLLGWPVALVRLGGGSAAAMGLLAWADAVGGRGRLSALVAGLACLGIFVIDPVSRWLRLGRPSLVDRLPFRWWVPPAVGLIQLALEVGLSRVPGPNRSPAEAGVIAGAALGAAALLAGAGSEVVGWRKRAGAPAVAEAELA